MSKAGAVRPRYIAFRLTAERAPSRRLVQEGLRQHLRRAGVAGPDLPELTRYAYPHGIVRARHDTSAQVRAALGTLQALEGEGRPMPARLATLGTSGTILALTDRLGILQERGAPAKR